MFTGQQCSQEVQSAPFEPLHDCNEDVALQPALVQSAQQQDRCNRSYEHLYQMAFDHLSPAAILTWAATCKAQVANVQTKSVSYAWCLLINRCVFGKTKSAADLCSLLFVEDLFALERICRSLHASTRRSIRCHGCIKPPSELRLSCGHLCCWCTDKLKGCHRAVDIINVRGYSGLRRDCCSGGLTGGHPQHTGYEKDRERLELQDDASYAADSAAKLLKLEDWTSELPEFHISFEEQSSEAWISQKKWRLHLACMSVVVQCVVQSVRDVRRVQIVGSLAKGTAVSPESTDVDLVFYFEGDPRRLNSIWTRDIQKSLTQLQEACSSWSGCAFKGDARNYRGHITLAYQGSVHFDIFAASTDLPFSISKLGHIHSADVDALSLKWWPMSTYHVNFIRQQPSFVLAAIRAAKRWRDQLHMSPRERPSSFLLELLVVHVYQANHTLTEHETFIALLESLADMRFAKFQPADLTHPDRHPCRHHSLECFDTTCAGQGQSRSVQVVFLYGLGYVIVPDPILPCMNVASGFENWDHLQRCAKQTFGQVVTCWSCTQSRPTVMSTYKLDSSKASSQNPDLKTELTSAGAPTGQVSSTDAPDCTAQMQGCNFVQVERSFALPAQRHVVRLHGKAGGIFLLQPKDILFSHSTIKRNFRNGQCLAAVISDILSGALEVSDIPHITVCWKEGLCFSMANRRLAVFRLLAMHGKWEHQYIPVMHVGEDEAWKFTQRIGHACPDRGHFAHVRLTGEVIGCTKADTYFRTDLHLRNVSSKYGWTACVKSMFPRKRFAARCDADDEGMCDIGHLANALDVEPRSSFQSGEFDFDCDYDSPENISLWKHVLLEDLALIAKYLGSLTFKSVAPDMISDVSMSTAGSSPAADSNSMIDDISSDADTMSTSFQPASREPEIFKKPMQDTVACSFAGSVAILLKHVVMIVPMGVYQVDKPSISIVQTCNTELPAGYFKAGPCIEALPHHVGLGSRVLLLIPVHVAATKILRSKSNGGWEELENVMWHGSYAVVVSHFCHFVPVGRGKSPVKFLAFWQQECGHLRIVLSHARGCAECAEECLHHVTELFEQGYVAAVEGAVELRCANNEQVCITVCGEKRIMTVQFDQLPDLSEVLRGPAAGVLPVVQVALCENEAVHKQISFDVLTSCPLNPPCHTQISLDCTRDACGDFLVHCDESRFLWYRQTQAFPPTNFANFLQDHLPMEGAFVPISIDTGDSISEAHLVFHTTERNFHVAVCRRDVVELVEHCIGDHTGDESTFGKIGLKSVTLLEVPKMSGGLVLSSSCSATKGSARKTHSSEHDRLSVQAKRLCESLLRRKPLSPLHDQAVRLIFVRDRIFQASQDGWQMVLGSSIADNLRFPSDVDSKECIRIVSKTSADARLSLSKEIAETCIKLHQQDDAVLVHLKCGVDEDWYGKLESLVNNESQPNAPPEWTRWHERVAKAMKLSETDERRASLRSIAHDLRVIRWSAKELTSTELPEKRLQLSRQSVFLSEELASSERITLNALFFIDGSFVEFSNALKLEWSSESRTHWQPISENFRLVSDVCTSLLDEFKAHADMKPLKAAKRMWSLFALIASPQSDAPHHVQQKALTELNRLKTILNGDCAKIWALAQRAKIAIVILDLGKSVVRHHAKHFRSHIQELKRSMRAMGMNSWTPHEISLLRKSKALLDRSDSEETVWNEIYDTLCRLASDLGKRSLGEIWGCYDNFVKLPESLLKDIPQTASIRCAHLDEALSECDSEATAIAFGVRDASGQLRDAVDALLDSIRLDRPAIVDRRGSHQTCQLAGTTRSTDGRPACRSRISPDCPDRPSGSASLHTVPNHLAGRRVRTRVRAVQDAVRIG